MPKIKAPTPEIVVADERKIEICWDIDIEINREFLNIYDNVLHTNHYDALVDVREKLEMLYAFLNENLGTHYVVKNDTESNLKDLYGK